MSKQAIGYIATVVIGAVMGTLINLSPDSHPNFHIALLDLLAIILVGLFFETGPAMLLAVWFSYLLNRQALIGLVVGQRQGSTITLDWLDICVFLAAAILAGWFSTKTKERLKLAQQRELELKTLFDASETIGHEVDVVSATKALSKLLHEGCNSANCLVWRIKAAGSEHLVRIDHNSDEPYANIAYLERLAGAAAEHRITIGFDDKSKELWQKASSNKDILGVSLTSGVFIPLTASSGLVGVLYVAPRLDSKPFSATEQRLILTLANHLAFVLARETLMEETARAAAQRESDILKDSIVSLVSHELRSPLAAIKATASAAMIENGQTQTLSEITAQTDRLNDVLTNLLDLSRLDAGAWNPEKDWCDVAEIIGTCLDRLGDEISARVNVKIEDNLPLVHVDYSQIAVAISNLLENAAKYSPPSSPIEVKVEAEHNGFDEIPTSVSIRVTDHGKGIPAGETERMFERFYRCPEHKNIGVSGTGLGLALVKSIVVAHHGRVWCANNTSSDQHGAVFTISIPVE